VGPVLAVVALAACGADDGDPAAAPVAGAFGGGPITAPPPTVDPEAGRELLVTAGCAACHGAQGEGGTGPTFVGLVGSERILADGRTVVADDDYLRRSILDPQADVVDGFFVPMPRLPVETDEVEQIVAYIRSLDGSG
jgi:cytochrome c oxidase subunit 2